MPHALLCMSHSPLLHHVNPPKDVKASVDAAFEHARSFVRDFEPDLVVNFGPDHYNGFFYDLMPPFCIGYAARGTGDYDSYAGTLNVPTDIAESLAEHVIDRGIDVAISRQMEVDHGAVQPMEIVFGDVSPVPVVPIFVNSVARPFVKMSRVRAFGHAVGEYFSLSDKKVLFIGSGGLSHDPPVPQIATATEAQRKLLTDGRNPTAEARAARQTRVIDTARAFTAGKADIMDLNPEWDRAFLDVCRSGRVEGFDRYTADDMDAVAGHSAHEVRNWVSAYAALDACGEYRVTYEYYRPIKEYIAGFAITTAVLETWPN
ncbi:3-carboxyethylcatechol 2,3-dioxygenase [Rhodococcus fascians]|nr:3-carboxyethylcatechol 2,3-dioxygenase [Rhodococcus fascians]MBY4237891.1 3-carboxyethylcatechol 2,3-dioxygenase [Rhodococcus fascians]MBY4253358.1 3-carboxyethylcatechol 2,3-dioxygenase [Rhodococcus fascians]MBY4268995.1 3-carboxyethylcatechol 2,3-dioxygenase [Rhodococcus fascians]MBY4275048.1 3-carboxyethylcatechol 2,3-dioxygenase [Rhodococcus fascians]